MIKNTILDSKQFENIITRLSHEIIEKNEDLEKLCLVGIRSRGDVISERIVEKINSIKNCNLKNGYIDVTFYRDDFMSNLGSHKIGPSNINFDVNDKKIILVDDVLYTGRTIRAAMDEIFAYGRPSAVDLCVIVDRGHRQLPIKANYIGKNIPTSENENVHVYVKAFDGQDEVVLVK
tara:strand:- start:293 stop:823 length:531 start_codon:yes stop_codon:yes gene_type:complete